MIRAPDDEQRLHQTGRVVRDRLQCQHFRSLSYARRAFGDRKLQTACGRREIARKEARNRDPRDIRWIIVARPIMRGDRHLAEKRAAARDAEQPQIGRCARERIGRRRFEGGQLYSGARASDSTARPSGLAISVSSAAFEPRGASQLWPACPQSRVALRPARATFRGEKNSSKARRRLAPAAHALSPLVIGSTHAAGPCAGNGIIKFPICG